MGLVDFFEGVLAPAHAPKAGASRSSSESMRNSRREPASVAVGDTAACRVFDVPDDDEDEDDAEYTTFVGSESSVCRGSPPSEANGSEISPCRVGDSQPRHSDSAGTAPANGTVDGVDRSSAKDSPGMCEHMRCNSGTSTATSVSTSSVEASAPNHVAFSRSQSAPRSRSVLRMDSDSHSGSENDGRAHRTYSDASVFFETTHGRFPLFINRFGSIPRANVIPASLARKAATLEKDKHNRSQGDRSVLKSFPRRKARSITSRRPPSDAQRSTTSPNTSRDKDSPLTSKDSGKKCRKIPFLSKPKSPISIPEDRSESNERGCFRHEALSDSRELSGEKPHCDSVAEQLDSRNRKEQLLLDSESSRTRFDQSTSGNDTWQGARGGNETGNSSSHAKNAACDIGDTDNTGCSAAICSSESPCDLSVDATRNAVCSTSYFSDAAPRTNLPTCSGTNSDLGASSHFASIESSQLQPSYFATCHDDNKVISRPVLDRPSKLHSDVSFDRDAAAPNQNATDIPCSSSDMCLSSTGAAINSVECSRTVCMNLHLSCDDDLNENVCGNFPRARSNTESRLKRPDQSVRDLKRNSDKFHKVALLNGGNPIEAPESVDRSNDSLTWSGDCLQNSSVDSAHNDDGANFLLDEGDSVTSTSSIFKEPAARRFSPSVSAADLSDQLAVESACPGQTLSNAPMPNNYGRADHVEKGSESHRRKNPKLQKFRPPPIVTPIDGGRGFSGASDLLDGAKRIPIVSAPMTNGSRITTYNPTQHSDDAVTISLADGKGSVLRLSEKAEPREVRIDCSKVSVGTPVNLASDNIAIYAVGCDSELSDPVSDPPAKDESRSSSSICLADDTLDTGVLGASASCLKSSEARNAFSSEQNSDVSRDSLERGIGLANQESAKAKVIDATAQDSTECSDASRARHGILPADPGHPQASFLAGLAASEHEEHEEHFVFGTDGQFTDGGFVITAKGLQQTPERVRIDEKADGERRRSTNFILARSLGEFQAGPMLGSGASGHVYLAKHRKTFGKMAVKVINVYDERKRHQLIKELSTLVSQSNGYLVRCYGAFYDGAGFVHVMLEYMDRGSLADAIRKVGPVPEPVIRHIARSCLNGLSYLHRNRVLHRDLKTANILLSRASARAKLSDFGLARDLVPGTSIADTFVGTVAYMSPERLHGSEYTYGSDMWALGISLLECVLGRYPFEKPRSYFDYVAAVRSNPWELVRSRVSDAMLDFLQQCTQIDPQKRGTTENLRKHEWMRMPLAGEKSFDRLSDQKAFVTWLDGIPETGEQACKGEGFADTGCMKTKEELQNRERLLAKMK